MKTIKKISLIAVCAFCLGTVKCYAVSGQITDNSVRLRKEASTSCETLELLYKNNDVEVIEKSGDFYKVTVRGLTGYVHQDFVKLNGELAPKEESNSTDTANTPNQEETKPKEENTPENKNPDEPQQNDATNQNTVNSVKTVEKEENIHIIPVINASIIDKINKEEQVTIKQVINEWAYIVYARGAGWIRENKLVDVSAVPANTTPTPEKTSENKTINKTGYTQYASVNFRKNPNTTAEVIRGLSLNTKLTVLEEVDEKWYKVDVNGTKGYISKDLVSFTKVETTTSRNTSSREVTTQNNTTDTTKTNTTQTETSVNITSSDKGQQIADMARKYVGCRYVYGASGPSSFDCSGLTMYVYRKFGYSLPHSASAQSNYGKAVSKSELKPGDLVFFSDYVSNKGIGHIGIYIGSGSFVHASTPKTGVIVSSINGDYYSKRYVTARRLVD